MKHKNHFAFARLFSSAVTSQALLSAGNFAIGLILIRNTSSVQYGYYVLAFSAILLLISLQNAFFNPPLAIRMTQLNPVGRGELVGGLYREQRRLLPVLGAFTVLVALGLWYAGLLNRQTLPLVLATVAAALAALHREYFRMVLFAYRRPQDVLYTDICYLILIVAGILTATFTQQPALTAILVLCLAAIVSGVFLARLLHRHEPWDIRGAQGILPEIIPMSTWSTAGAAIHWTFTQGYTYLVAGVLSVSAVSAIAATRLLLMPINLLSTGIRSLMLPLAASWLDRHGASVVWRRLIMFAISLATVSLCYFGVLWLLRDWIFDTVLKKQFAQQDTLLLLWGAVFLFLVIRDQLVYLLAAQGRFQVLTTLTFFCAVIALTASYTGMLKLGVTGALLGILIGEVINTIGIIVLSLRKPASEFTAQLNAAQ